MRFGKLEWIVSALTAGFTFSNLYTKGKMIYVNVPYFSEIASASDPAMKQWMYVNGAQFIIFGISAFILSLFLIGSIREVWFTKKEKGIKEEKVKIKGNKAVVEPPHEPRVIKFD